MLFLFQPQACRGETASIYIDLLFSSFIFSLPWKQFLTTSHAKGSNKYKDVPIRIDYLCPLVYKYHICLGGPLLFGVVFAWFTGLSSLPREFIDYIKCLKC